METKSPSTVVSLPNDTARLKHEMSRAIEKLAQNEVVSPEIGRWLSERLQPHLEAIGKVSYSFKVADPRHSDQVQEAAHELLCQAQNAVLLEFLSGLVEIALRAQPRAERSLI